MNIKSITIEIQNEILALTNQRAIFWEKQNCLIVSDLHIGKTAHFRKNGIAIPDDVLVKDLDRLSILLKHFNVNKLIIVGDLFHADYNINIDFFNKWLQQYSNTEFVLIPGNHDKKILHASHNLQIKIAENELNIFPFKFIHEYENSSDGFSICGHLHPGVAIQGFAKQNLRLPCYIKTNDCLYLPAFSLFTGLYTKSKFNEATYYPFSDEFIDVLK